MTAKKKYDNETKVIKWIMFDGKNCLKFEDDDKMYSLADNVLNEDKTALKYGEVANGDTVEVGINEDEVVFIKKVDAKETKKEETKTEDNSEVKELTVEGKPKQGFSILFQEDKDNWHQVNPKCQKFVASLNKGDKVKATFGKFQATSKEGKKYPKDGVVFIEKIMSSSTSADTDVTETPKTKANYSNSTNNSIETQVALKSAVEIVKVLLEKEMLDKGKIKEALVDLTKNCYDAMKQL